MLFIILLTTNTKAVKNILMLQVIVGDQNKLEVALRMLKKKIQKEGIIKEARRRAEYEKPSEKKKRKRKESISRIKRRRK